MKTRQKMGTCHSLALSCRYVAIDLSIGPEWANGRRDLDLGQTLVSMANHRYALR